MKVVKSKSYKINTKTSTNKFMFNEIDGFISKVREIYPVKATVENRKVENEKIKILSVSAPYPMSVNINTNKLSMSTGIVSSMYAYTLAILDCVVTVRTRSQFEELLGRISNEWLASKELKSTEAYIKYKELDLVKYQNLKVGVQNLQFEFYNLLGEWQGKYSEDEVNEKLNPFFIRSELVKVEHPTLPILFVDTYKLVNTSLSSALKNEVLDPEYSVLITGKMDYTLIRTSESVLTEDEALAVYNETLSLTSVISSLCDRYNVSWSKLPLTRTGCTKLLSRRMVKGFAGSDERRSEIAKELSTGTMTLSQLSINKGALIGGIAAVNDNYKNIRINEAVGHVDYSTFHTSQMMFHKFPVGKNYDLTPSQFVAVNERREREGNMGFVGQFGFYNVRLKEGVLLPFKSVEEDDANIVNPILKNGRLFSADALTVTFNSVDYDLFCSQYEFDAYEFYSGFGFYMKHIYDEFRQMLSVLFSDKTKIKNQIKLEIRDGNDELVSELNIKYALSKISMSGQFGITAQTPIYGDSNFEMNDGFVSKSKSTYSNTESQYKQYKNRNLRYNESKGVWEYKLNDPYDRRWGSFVSAYSHVGLVKLVEAIGADSWVKSDTDSAYYIKSEVKDKDFIDNVNKDITELAQSAGIPEEWYVVEGEHLGHLSVEKDVSSFIAKGPKQHQQVFEDGSYEYTNSGISKEVLNRLHELGQFNYDEDEIDIDANDTGLFKGVRIINQPIGEEFIGYDGTKGVIDSSQGYVLEPVSFKIKS